MWIYYLLVFFGAFAFDVVPFPFLPAFTIMAFLQIKFHLNVWAVISIGVVGSMLGRYVLTLYIPLLSGKFFNASKNKDVEFLGKIMKENRWKGQLAVIAYSLLPLPTTPLFLAAGMSKINPMYVIPAFFIGKFTSDAVAVHLGKYAAKNVHALIKGATSWKSILGLALGLLLLCALLFIDWRTLIQKKKFQLKFKIWK
jgi:membrane protein YqaA with SNARE-associated domain